MQARQLACARGFRELALGPVDIAPLDSDPWTGFKRVEGPSGFAR